MTMPDTIGVEEWKALAAKGMSEDQLQQIVIDYARSRGWMVFHARDARRSEPGFPDALFLRRSRALAVEFKRQDGKLRPGTWTKKGRYLPGQDEWLEAFAGVGIESYVLRPSDWMDGTIERILEGI